MDDDRKRLLNYANGIGYNPPLTISEEELRNDIERRFDEDRDKYGPSGWTLGGIAAMEHVRYLEEFPFYADIVIRPYDYEVFAAQMSGDVSGDLTKLFNSIIFSAYKEKLSNVFTSPLIIFTTNKGIEYGAGVVMRAVNNNAYQLLKLCFPDDETIKLPVDQLLIRDLQIIRQIIKNISIDVVVLAALYRPELVVSISVILTQNNEKWLNKWEDKLRTLSDRKRNVYEHYKVRASAALGLLNIYSHRGHYDKDYFRDIGSSIFLVRSLEKFLENATGTDKERMLASLPWCKIFVSSLVVPRDGTKSIYDDALTRNPLKSVSNRRWGVWKTQCNATIPQAITSYPEAYHGGLPYLTALIANKVTSWDEVMRALNESAINGNDKGFLMLFDLCLEGNQSFDPNIIRDAVYGGSPHILRRFFNGVYVYPGVINDQYGEHGEIFFDAAQFDLETSSRLFNILLENSSLEYDFETILQTIDAEKRDILIGLTK